MALPMPFDAPVTSATLPSSRSSILVIVWWGRVNRLAHKSSLHGRPGFVDLLRAVDEAWRTKRSEVVDQAGQLAETIRSHTMLAAPQGEADLGPALLQGGYAALRAAYDPEWGGFGQAPK